MEEYPNFWSGSPFGNPTNTGVQSFIQGYQPQFAQMQVDPYQAQQLPMDTFDPNNPQATDPGNYNDYMKYLMMTGLMSNMGAGVPAVGETGYGWQMLGKSIGARPFIQDIQGNSELTSGQRKGLKGANITRGITGSLLGGLDIAKNVMMGMGQEKRQQFLTQDKYQKQREAMFANNQGYPNMFNFGYMGTQFHQQGGQVEGMMNHVAKGAPPSSPQKNRQQVPYEDILSGKYITGLPEKKEFLANVEFEKGEFVKYPDGVISKVLGSNHENGGEKLKVPEGTKILSNNLKIGRDFSKSLKELNLMVSPKTTYAKAFEKFSEKIGVTKVQDSQAKKYKELEKNKLVKDETTRLKNEEFIGKGIYEDEVEKKQLQYLQNLMFEQKFFPEQESSKNKKEFDGKQITFKDGGKVCKIPVKFRDGGIYISKENLEPFKKWVNTRGYKSIKEASQSLRNYKNGGEVKEYENAGEVSREEAQRQYQELLGLPGVVGNSNNTQGLGNIAYPSANVLHPNIDPTLAGRVIPTQSQTNKERPTFYGGMTDDDFALSINYNPWYFTEERLKTFDPNNPKDIEDYQKAINKREKENLIKEDGKYGKQTASYGLIDDTSTTQTQDEVVQETSETTTDGVLPEYDPKTGQMIPAASLPFINQTPLPPTGLVGNYLYQPSFEEISPKKVSPEQALRENDRMFRAGLEAVRGNVGAQQGSNIANLLGQLSEADANAILQTDLTNLQSASAADQFNAQMRMQEDIQRAQGLQSFEARQLQALANTKEEERRYFDRILQNKIGQRKEDLALKVLGATAPNYRIDPVFGIVYNPAAERGLSIPTNATSAQMQAAWDAILSPTQKKKAQEAGLLT